MKVEIEIPEQLEKLYKLLDYDAQSDIQGYVNDLAKCNASSGSDERSMATDYFMRANGYSEGFEYDDILEMIYELDAMRRLFYEYGNDRIDEYKERYSQEVNDWYERWSGQKQ